MLRFPTEQNKVHQAFAELNKRILGAPDSQQMIRLANRIWAHKGFRPDTRFLQLLRERYGVDLVQLDFRDQAELACVSINQWLEEQTAGKITNLISPKALTELTRLLLVNTVYFKGCWTEKFDESDTREVPFCRGFRSKTTVKMMHQRANFAYAQVGGVQVLELPYGDRDLSMVVLLPKNAGGLAKFEAALSASNVKARRSELVTQPVEVFLPRFRLTEQVVLSGVLQTMGMVTAFDISAANFFGITDPGACLVTPICLSEVFHKSVLDVNEEGTEATAATAVTVALCSAVFHRSPPVPVFRADHPFVFMIRHLASDSILFMGRVTNPEV